MASSSETSNLQTINYVNALAYASNFLVVFGSTVAGLPDNGTLSNKYQTIVTPAPYAFAIWGIIFTAEVIWTIAQMFPAYRNHPVVLSVGYNFALACVAQGMWTVFFGLECMLLSLVAMVGILVPLVLIMLDLSKNSSSIGEYWLLKFPFLIHASWIMAATVVNFNVVLVAYKASAKTQAIAGWISLVVVFFVGTYFATTRWRTAKKGVWVVPLVLVWASFAIASELSNPRDSILASFSESTVEQIQGASRTVAILLLLVTIVEALKNTRDGNEMGENAEYSALS